MKIKTFLLLVLLSISFHNLYSAEIVVKIEAVSILPNPKTSQYPNCDFTVLAKDYKKNKPYLLVFRGFKNFKLTPNGHLIKKGNILTIDTVPFESLSTKRQQWQRADDIMNYELPEFFVKNFHIANDSDKKKDYIIDYKKTVTGIKNILPKNIKEIKLRQQAIMSDLKQVTCTLENEQDIENIIEILQTRYKTGDILWLEDSLVKIPNWNAVIRQQHVTSINNSLFSALLILNKECKKRNVDLIVLSIPYDWEYIIPNLLTKKKLSNKIFAVNRLKLIKKCLMSNIEVIDLGPSFSKHFFDFTCITGIPQNDFHWDSGGIEIAANVIAKRLIRYDFSSWMNDDNNFSFSTMNNMKKSLFPPGNKKFDGIYKHKIIEFKNTDKTLLSADKSPILILGDSYASTPRTNMKGSIGAFLAAQTKVIPYVFSRHGSTRLIWGMQKNNFSLLNGRKVCLFVFAPVYLAPHIYWYYINNNIESDFIKSNNLLKITDIANNERYSMNDISFINSKSELKLNAPVVGKEYQITYSLKKDLRNKKEKYFIEIVFNKNSLATGHLKINGLAYNNIPFNRRYLIIIPSDRIKDKIIVKMKIRSMNRLSPDIVIRRLMISAL